MKRILRYISFTLMYLVISIASAYGVILLSFNNNFEEDSTSDAQMPAQISNIMYNLMQDEITEFDLNLSIQNETTSFHLKSNCYLDLSEGLENLLIKMDIDIYQNSDFANSTEITVIYKDQNVFVEGFNNKFFFNTNDLFGSVSQILNIIDLNLPSIDIQSLNLNEILNTFSNLNETTLENVKIIEIDVPTIQKLIITTDLNYNLMAFEIPVVQLEDSQVKIEGIFNLYPKIQNIEINSSEFKDLTIFTELANKFLVYSKNNIIAIEGNLLINSQNLDNLNYQLFFDPNTFTSTLQIEDYLSLTIKNNAVYFNLFNIYLKYDLKELPSLIKMLSEDFHLSIPDEITNLFINLSENNNFLQSIFDNLPLTDFNINDLDLSFIGDIQKNQSNYMITLTDLTSFTFETTDSIINKLLINNSYFETEMVFKENMQMPLLEENLYKETELSTLTPFISSFNNLFASNSISGDFILTMPNSNTVLNGNIQIMLNDNFEVYLTINDLQINVAIYESKIFIEMGQNLSLLFDLKNPESLTALDSLKNALKELFNIEISKDNILSLIASQLHSDVNKSLISKIYEQQSELNIELANKILLSFNNLENGIAVNLTGKNTDSSSLQLNLFSSESTTPLFEIDKSKNDSLISSTNFIVNLGLLGINIAISTNSKEVLETEMSLFGFNAKLNFVFNADKTIKQASIILQNNNLKIQLYKDENESKITLGDFIISSIITEELKIKGEEILNKIPFNIEEVA